MANMTSSTNWKYITYCTVVKQTDRQIKGTEMVQKVQRRCR